MLTPQVTEKQTLLGYVPCLTEKLGFVTDQSPIDYMKSFDQEQGNILSVGWNQIGNDCTPVLFIKNAKDVCKHLTEWMNGDTSWFTFVWETQINGRYALALISDVARTIRASGIENLETTDVFHWVWVFNSINPNFKVKKFLKTKGMQKVSIADYTTKKIEKTYLFPVIKYSEMPRNSYMMAVVSRFLFARK